jgi:predicted lipoprotein with Yx(FWY)xxD motif
MASLVRRPVVVAAVFGFFLGLVAAPHALAQTSVTVNTETTPYGTVLATSTGMSLYELSADEAVPGKSACTGACQTAWPPLTAPSSGAVTAGSGVDATKLGTISVAGPNGTTINQVTYAGHPLYQFIRDTAAGQTNGLNVGAFGGIWRLVTAADGTPDAGVATVQLESSPNGQVLATPTAFGSHRTLYMLEVDAPGTSSCTPANLCTGAWPPLLTTGAPQAGTGVDASKLGTLKRPDGTIQVTYGGVALYLYSGDLAAGAASGLTNGEDVIDSYGIWYTLSPAGTIVPGVATLTSQTTSLGTVVAYVPTGSGPSYALYADTKDSSTASACTGACARIWPPVLTSGPTQLAAGSGLSASSLGTIARADGTTQVTYNGHPLYLFAKGFTGVSGQGVGPFVLMGSNGQLLATPPSATGVLAVPQVTHSGPGVSASFTVGFHSTQPGNGLVLFGPSCTALVETATMDSGAGTTSHSVTVTGNDLPGTVGDIGIQPGQTYFYEVVTVTSSANPDVDNNGGKCYSVTIPSS